MPKPPRTRTDYPPTGRQAKCPVCDQILDTVQRRVTDQTSKRASVEDRHLLPKHPNPLFPDRYDCCESLDPATDSAYRAAARTIGAAVRGAA